MNVYVEINHFKLSRFNDNDTGQQIRKLVLKARLKKKHLFSYQFKNFFSPKKTETISSNWIGINFKMFIQIFRLIFYKFNIRYHTLKCSLKYFQ